MSEAIMLDLSIYLMLHTLYQSHVEIQPYINNYLHFGKKNTFISIMAASIFYVDIGILKLAEM